LLFEKKKQKDAAAIRARAVKKNPPPSLAGDFQKYKNEF